MIIPRIVKFHKTISIEKSKLYVLLLAIYFVAAPLDFIPLVPDVSLTKVLVVIPLIGAFLYFKYAKLQLDSFLLFPIMYLLCIFISITVSVDQSLTIQRFVTLALNISIMIFMSMFFYNEHDLSLLKKGLVYGGWLTLILAFFYSDQSLMGGRLTVNVNGTYQDPNYLIGFIILSIIFYLSHFIETKKKSSLIKLLILFTVVLLTGSRGGLLAVIGGVFVYLIFWIKSNSRSYKKLVQLMLVVILIFIIVLFMIQLLPESLTQRYSILYTLNDGGAHRFDLWRSSLDAYLNAPLINQIFGYGAGTIRKFTFNGNVAHNVWIETLVENGAIGTIVLFIFYTIFFIKSIKLKEYVIVGTFSGYLIMTLSLSLYSYKPIWNLLLYIMILKVNRKEKIKPIQNYER